MGLFDGWRTKRLLSDAERLLSQGKADEAWAVLDPELKKGGVRPLVELAERLDAAGNPDAARTAAQRALELAPGDWDALVELAEIERGAGDLTRALGVYEQLHAKDPSHEAVARIYAGLLTPRGEAEKAAQVLAPFTASRDARTLATLGQARFALGDVQGAADVLLEVAKAHEASRSHGPPEGMDADAWLDVRLLLGSVGAELRLGEEGVNLLEPGQHAGRAGAAYRALAGARMEAASTPPTTLKLATPEATAAAGERLLANPAHRVLGHVQLGSAALRLGELAKAKEEFLKARRLAPDHFASAAGYAAALDCERVGLRDLAAKLPDPGKLPKALVQVVPDWEALTELERKVVAATVRPLAAALPKLAAAKRRLRILPVEVRPVDLPEVARLEGEEADVAAAPVAGLAGHAIGLAKIEELLDVTAAGWTLGHELAHLAFEVLPDDDLDALHELFDGAAEFEQEFDPYQLSDPREFFAVAYTDYLARQAGQPLGHEVAADGHLAKVFALIDGIAQRG